MAEKQKSGEPKPKPAPTLYLITFGKIAEGMVMLLAAISVYLLAEKNLPDLFDQFIRWIHLDPESRLFNNISDWLDTITPRNVHIVASWFFLYGLFKVIGGVGLAFRARWAVWLAIGESAFFIPIEIFELTRRRGPTDDGHVETTHVHHFAHPREGVAIVLIINILIVWYLLVNRERLFKHHR
jgi:uncharacterized membrane protein (DUF2068 family)